MNAPRPDPPPGVAVRRRGRDRRRRPTSILGVFTSPGRRRGFRRAGEEINAYVDRPGPEVTAWAVSLICLSALDALLTLFHIQAGGREIAPTMRFALTQGQGVFLASKMGATALGVFVLALHQNFRLARFWLRLLFWGYIALLGYHLFLIASR